MFVYCEKNKEMSKKRGSYLSYEETDVTNKYVPYGPRPRKVKKLRSRAIRSEKGHADVRVEEGCSGISVSTIFYHINLI